MAITGNLLFAPGSSVRIRTDAAGNNDRIVLGGPEGRAYLQGGLVDVQAAPGSYAFKTQYTILTAPGGITGSFAGTQSNLAFLTPKLSYDASHAFLSLTRNDLSFASVAQTGTQAIVGEALARLQNNPNSDTTSVLNALTALSAVDARKAYDSIAGGARSAAPQLGGFNLRALNQNITGRLGLVEAGGNSGTSVAALFAGGIKLAYDESVRSDAMPVYAAAGGSTAGMAGSADLGFKHGFWLRAYGGSGRVDGDAGNNGYSYRLGGTMGGYDYALGAATTLGLFASYSAPRVDQDAAAGQTATRSSQVGLYGRHRTGMLHIDGIVSHARNSSDSNRPVVVGPLNRVATANFNGSTTSAQVEAGVTYRGRADITPMAGLTWTRQQQNAYTEQGAGALNLDVPGRRFDSLRSTLGVRAVLPFDTAGGMRMALEGRAAWAHEFRDQGVLNARLAGDPAGASFSVAGITIPRDSAVLGVGLAAQASRALRFYADLNTEANRGQRSVALSVGLRAVW